MMEKIMPITVTRAASQAHVPGTTRADVAVGTVFQVRNRSGAQGTKTYAAIGSNGKNFSIDLANGQLASTKKADRQVKTVGSFHYELTVNPTSQDVRKRSQVKEGEVFHVKGGTKLYGHAGMATNGEPRPRYIGVTFDTMDNSTTTDGNKNVVVLGKFKIVQD
jgi:hypothetical protein